MKNVYNCGNCNYNKDCEKEDEDFDKGCFEHSHFLEDDPTY